MPLRSRPFTPVNSGGIVPSELIRMGKTLRQTQDTSGPGLSAGGHGYTFRRIPDDWWCYGRLTRIVKAGTVDNPGAFHKYEWTQVFPDGEGGWVDVDSPAQGIVAPALSLSQVDNLVAYEFNNTKLEINVEQPTYVPLFKGWDNYMYFVFGTGSNLPPGPTLDVVTNVCPVYGDTSEPNKVTDIKVEYKTVNLSPGNQIGTAFCRTTQICCPVPPPPGTTCLQGVCVGQNFFAGGPILYATVTNVSGCTCLEGIYPLYYSFSGCDRWLSAINFPSCSEKSISFLLKCDCDQQCFVGAPYNFILTTIGGCGISKSNQCSSTPPGSNHWIPVDTGYTCDPVHLSFSNLDIAVDPSSPCCCCLGGIINVTITS